MKIKKYAKKYSNIPLPTLKMLADAKIIHNPLTREDCIGLDFLEEIWDDENMIFVQMKEMPTSERQKLFHEIDGLQEMYDEHQRLCSNK
ncbi:MAG: hypothetical protein JZU65_12715 [Chlorobium sp.]|nr:hypothetical protein [Chlorobium sp.]